MEMDITRLAIANLSKDDERYQEKLATLQDAGFWYDPVNDCWVKPEPLVDEEVHLQYFGSEGVYLDRDETCSFRKMLFFLIENGFEYDESSDRWFRPKRPKLLALNQSIFQPRRGFRSPGGGWESPAFFRRFS